MMHCRIQQQEQQEQEQEQEQQEQQRCHPRTLRRRIKGKKGGLTKIASQAALEVLQVDVGVGKQALRGL